MPALSTIIAWLQSGHGRLIAAAVLFGLMWALKSVPWVKSNLLTTPRRKQLAVAFLATAPAVAMLSEAAPTSEVVATALTLFVGAMGINALRPSKAVPDPSSGSGMAKEEKEPEPGEDAPDEDAPDSTPEKSDEDKPGGDD